MTILIALLLTVSMLVGCGGTTTETTPAPKQEADTPEAAAAEEASAEAGGEPVRPDGGAVSEAAGACGDHHGRERTLG